MGSDPAGNDEEIIFAFRLWVVIEESSFSPKEK